MIENEGLVQKVQEWLDSIIKTISDNGGELPMSDDDMEVGISMASNPGTRLLGLIFGAEMNNLIMFYIGMSWQQFKNDLAQKDDTLSSLLGGVDIPDKL